MKNRARHPATAEDRIAARDRGREQVRTATRAAVAGGLALTALFAGIAYSGTHTTTATLASTHRNSTTSGSSTSAGTSSTGTSSSGSTSTSGSSSSSTGAVSSSTATPVASSGGS